MGKSAACKAKASKKTKAKCAVAPKSKATRVPASIAEQLELADKTSIAVETASTKRKRTHKASFSKLITDNFPGFSNEEKYMILVNGKCLVDVVEADKDASVVMGKTYYAQKRKEYRSPSNPFNRLEIKDIDEEKDDNLVEAIERLNSSKRSIEPLLLWASTVDKVCQMDFVALLRQLLLMPHVRLTETNTLTVAVMRMIVRLELQTEHATEVNIMKVFFDGVCCKTLAASKRQRLSGASWWSRNSSWAKLVLPEAATTKGLNEQHDLANVTSEIDEVVASSEVGNRLLGQAQRQIVMDQLNHQINKHLELLGGHNITLAFMNKMKRDFVTDMKSVGIDPMKSYYAAKQVRLEYRGRAIGPSVSSPIDHYDLGVQCFVLSLGVDLGQLTPLWCEEELVEKCREPSTVTVDDDCLQASRLSRQIVSENLDVEEASADLIIIQLRRTKKLCLQSDRQWNIEYTFWDSMCGETVEGRVHDLILDCLPSQTKKFTLPESARRLDALASSTLVEFFGMTSKKLVTTISGYVDALSNSHTLNLDRVGNSVFAIQLKTRLKFFCTYTPPAGSGAAKPTLTGEAAAKALLGVLKAQYADGGKANKEVVQACLAGAWLLGAADKKDLDSMREKVLAKVSLGVAGDTSHEKKSSAAKKASIDTKAAVRALYAK